MPASTGPCNSSSDPGVTTLLPGGGDFDAAQAVGARRAEATHGVAVRVHDPHQRVLAGVHQPVDGRRAAPRLRHLHVDVARVRRAGVGLCTLNQVDP
jgi:hypothetical protein